MDAYFADAQFGWVSNSSGSIWRTTDGGKTWLQASAPVISGLSNLNFANSREGWVTGRAGAALHTADGGATWQLVPVPFDTTPVALNRTGSVGMAGDFVTQDAGRTWLKLTPDRQLASPGGVLWYFNGQKGGRSDDLGQSYASIVDPSEGLALRPCAPLWIQDDSFLMVCGDGEDTDQVLFGSRDRGQTWTGASIRSFVHGAALPAVAWADPAVTKILLYFHGDVYRSEDGGKTWDDIGDGVVLRSGTVVKVQGTNIARSVDLGRTWSTQATPVVASDLSLRRIGPAALVLEGTPSGSSDRQSRWSLDDGATWSNFNVPTWANTSPRRTVVWMIDALRGWQVTDAGNLLRTTDGGATWGLTKTGLSAGAMLVAPRLQFVGDKTGWLMSADASLYRTTDSGTSWDRVSGPQGPLSVSEFELLDAGRIWVAQRGTSPSFLVSSDGGLSWTAIRAPAYATALAWTPAGQLMAYGDGGVIATTADMGQTWRQRYSGTLRKINRLRFAGASVAFAVGEGGVVLRSADQGATWAVLRTGSESLRDLSFASAAQGWVVGDRGTILATVDSGLTWALQPAGATAVLDRVQAVDTGHVWGTGDGGFILTTRTGGR